MRRLLRRFGFHMGLGLLTAVIGLSGLFIVLVVLPELQAAAVSPAPSPSASPNPPGVVMSWVNLPADADCAACHLTQGGVAAVEVPRVAHPLRGWTDCTACHANDRLVATAPGHAGIHATDCLVCHEPAELPAPLSRPHRELQNQNCLECHGRTAPLPEDMAHREQSVCWLCHRLPEEQPVAPQHAITANQTDCLTCHHAGDQGALPADHASRTANECVLCHVPSTASTFQPVPAPTGPPSPLQGLRWPLVFVRDS